jgi:hypothetical protein
MVMVEQGTLEVDTALPQNRVLPFIHLVSLYKMILTIPTHKL